MQMARLALLAATFTTLPGCFLSPGTPLARRIDAGRPMEDPGPDAYLVWHDGGEWHLRVRSELGRVFHGRIDSGFFSRMRPVGVPDDAVEARSGWIAFSFLGSEHETGFDWSGFGCPELALYIDGDPRPLRVAAGAYAASPARTPFVLCP
jgi:hypothetical protein